MVPGYTAAGRAALLDRLSDAMVAVCVLGCGPVCVLGCAPVCVLGCAPVCVLGCASVCVLGCGPVCVLGCALDGTPSALNPLVGVLAGALCTLNGALDALFALDGELSALCTLCTLDGALSALGALFTLDGALCTLCMLDGALCALSVLVGALAAAPGRPGVLVGALGVRKRPDFATEAACLADFTCLSAQADRMDWSHALQ